MERTRLRVYALGYICDHSSVDISAAAQAASIELWVTRYRPKYRGLMTDTSERRPRLQEIKRLVAEGEIDYLLVADKQCIAADLRKVRRFERNLWAQVIYTSRVMYD